MNPTDPSPAGPPEPLPPGPDGNDELAGQDDLAPDQAPRSTPEVSRGSALEWLTRRTTLEEARSRVRDRPPTKQRALRLACLAEEGAERALNPVDPFRHGPGTALALSLYQEALYWALLAQPDAPDSPDLPAAWAAAPREVLTPLVTSLESLDLIEQHLVRSSFPRHADLPEEKLRRVALQARALVGALLEQAEGAEREVSRVHLQRWLRSLVVLVALVAVVFGAFQGAQRLTAGPNLAVGRAWRASSAYPNFNAASHLCDGNTTKILFHTNEEDRPWFEIDLGASSAISVVEVTNRTDGFQERAVPLILEVSEDRNRWHEVARRNDTFNHWRAKFAPRKARYVRVKAQRKTFLHLEGVAVRAK